MLKKLSLVLLTIIFGLSLSACSGEEPLSDADQLRAIKETITFDSLEVSEDITIPSVENEDVTVSWVSSSPDHLAVDGTVNRPDYTQSDKSVSLTVSLELNGVVITKVFEFTVLAHEIPENLELNTDETDALEMNFAYQNSNFITDGVGEVDLVRCVDGDTALFTEGGASFSVRFLGINTPESTAKFEPWGKAASDFTCAKLEAANQIVLQSDPGAGRLDSYGERWLAWVWYDGRLLNLELVELAYTKASGGIDTYYGEMLFDISLQVQFTHRRVWGETDPNYDYSLEGIQLTIEELVTNPSEYVGKKVAISGIVTRRIGGAAFIQQGDYGIYLYNRAWAPDLTIGNEIQLSGLTVTHYPDEESGALQVSGYSTADEYSEVLSRDNVVTPETITISELTDNHVGSLLRLENLTVKSVYTGDNSFTVTAEDAFGNTITLRKDAGVTADISATDFTVGATVTVVGPLSRYNSTYQLMLSSEDDITIE